MYRALSRQIDCPWDSSIDFNTDNEELQIILKFNFYFSGDFHSVLKLCLDRGFAKLLDTLGDQYKHLLDDQHRQKQVC